MVVAAGDWEPVMPDGAVIGLVGLGEACATFVDDEFAPAAVVTAAPAPGPAMPLGWVAWAAAVVAARVGVAIAWVELECAADNTMMTSPKVNRNAISGAAYRANDGLVCGRSAWLADPELRC